VCVDAGREENVGMYVCTHVCMYVRRCVEETNQCMHACICALMYVCMQVRVDAGGEAIFTRCLIRSEEGSGCVTGPDGLLILRACTVRQCYGDGVLAHNGGTVVCDESTISDCGGTGMRAAYAYSENTGHETMSYNADNSDQDAQSRSVSSECIVTCAIAAGESNPRHHHSQHNIRTQNQASFDGVPWQGTPGHSFSLETSKTQNKDALWGVDTVYNRNIPEQEYSQGESTPQTQTQKGPVGSARTIPQNTDARGNHSSGANDSMDSILQVDSENYNGLQGIFNNNHEHNDLRININDDYDRENEHNSMHSGHNSNSINTFSSGSDFAKKLVRTKPVLVPLCGVPRIAARKCTVSQNRVYGVLATFGGRCEVEECSINANRRHGLSVAGINSFLAGNKCEISHNGEGGVQVCTCVYMHVYVCWQGFREWWHVCACVCLRTYMDTHADIHTQIFKLDVLSLHTLSHKTTNMYIHIHLQASELDDACHRKTPHTYARTRRHVIIKNRTQ
jgi:hypothetical protein